MSATRSLLDDFPLTVRRRWSVELLRAGHRAYNSGCRVPFVRALENEYTSMLRRRRLQRRWALDGAGR